MPLSDARHCSVLFLTLLMAFVSPFTPSASRADLHPHSIPWPHRSGRSLGVDARNGYLTLAVQRSFERVLADWKA